MTAAGHQDASVPRRRRVLLLTQDLEVWGAQRQIVELARGLDGRSYDVRIGTLQPGGPLTEEVNALGISLEDFSRRWRWDLSPINRLATYLRNNTIDIVHSFMFLPNLYARCAGRLAGTTAIISSLRSVGIPGWPRYALDVATCFLCDAMIANSEAGRDHYVRRGGLRRRMVVVRNGLSRERILRPPGRDHRSDWRLTRFEHLVGMVSSIEPRKDQELLVKAMRTVVQTHEHTGLVLAGDGSQRQAVEQLVHSLGLASHIVFLGKIREPEFLYPLLDIYVQASKTEGISNSILEAMAHSLPVIATDVGGNREVVMDGRTGILVRKGDVDGLARAILDLLTHPERRAAMGREGRERCRTVFSLEAMVAATERVYDRVVGAKAEGTRALASANRVE